MYFYCYYGHPEFKTYTKKKLLKRYIDKVKSNLYLVASLGGQIEFMKHFNISF